MGTVSTGIELERVVEIMAAVSDRKALAALARTVRAFAVAEEDVNGTFRVRSVLVVLTLAHAVRVGSSRLVLADGDLVAGGRDVDDGCRVTIRVEANGATGTDGGNFFGFNRVNGTRQKIVCGHGGLFSFLQEQCKDGPGPCQPLFAHTAFTETAV